MLKNDVRLRDSLINSLTERLRLAERERDAAMEGLQTRAAENPESQIEKRRSKPPPEKAKKQKPETRKKRETTEDGLDHLDTEYRQYLQERPQKYVAGGKKTRRVAKIPRMKSDESPPQSEQDSDSLGWI
jgi:hypothetical protein